MDTKRCREGFVQVTKKLPGMFTLVLHSHLPWLNHHGRWPVGEEWLYQAWSESYIPLLEVLEELSHQGFHDFLSLGMTPILHNALDDQYSLFAMQQWLDLERLRALEATRNTEKRAPNNALGGENVRQYGKYEQTLNARKQQIFSDKWIHGFSNYVKKLIDHRSIDFLSGPLTHSFQPTVDPLLRNFTLSEGLKDARLRTGYTAQGIWAPECAFLPGMEQDYAKNNIKYFLVDGPALQHNTAQGYTVNDSDVAVFGRDMELSYRIWSPNSGYPGHSLYRDFYTYHSKTGLKTAQVTSSHVSSSEKKPYDAHLVTPILDNHVQDFITHVKNKIISEYERTNSFVHIVVAFDTELFGHWWHEGPTFIRKLFPALHEQGIECGSLRKAYERGTITKNRELGPCSWGTGKDFHVWNGPQVHDIDQLGQEVTKTALHTLKNRSKKNRGYDVISNQILRENLLTLSSDWAFLITKDTAADYARQRAHKHAHATREICAASDSGYEEYALTLAKNWMLPDGCFPQLNAQNLIRMSEEMLVGYS